MLDTALERARCPFCGEPVELLIDCSVPSQDYFEDCPVCCRPMRVQVHVGPDGSPNVVLRHEDDA